MFDVNTRVDGIDVYLPATIDVVDVHVVRVFGQSPTVGYASQTPRSTILGISLPLLSDNCRYVDLRVELDKFNLMKRVKLAVLSNYCTSFSCSYIESIAYAYSTCYPDGRAT
jgi:hypothetical protein